MNETISVNVTNVNIFNTILLIKTIMSRDGLQNT